MTQVHRAAPKVTKVHVAATNVTKVHVAVTVRRQRLHLLETKVS